ncbi:MAG: hypothetical protein PGN25_16155 [Methylorubrum populi]
MDAETTPRALSRPSEAAAARAPAAVAGRERLTARLVPAQLEAFREAVRRCSASAAEA